MILIGMVLTVVSAILLATIGGAYPSASRWASPAVEVLEVLFLFWVAGLLWIAHLEGGWLFWGEPPKNEAERHLRRWEGATVLQLYFGNLGFLGLLWLLFEAIDTLEPYCLLCIPSARAWLSASLALALVGGPAGLAGQEHVRRLRRRVEGAKGPRRYGRQAGCILAILLVLLWLGLL